MFTPPEIPLSGYVPPKTELYLPQTSSSNLYQHSYENAYAAPPSVPSDYYHAPSTQQSDYSAPQQSKQQEYYGAPATKQPEFYQPQQYGNALAPTCKKVDPMSIYSHHQPVQNFTPKPFTPSPISNEKLAIFEPAKKHAPPVSIRRPLTIPNQVVRNVSPTPFASQYDSYQSSPWPQSTNSNRLSFTSSNYAPLSSSAPPPGSSFNSSEHQENYNRAARGWHAAGDFYRPISFTKQQLAQTVELPYTDF